MNTLLLDSQVSLIHTRGLPTIPSPTTWHPTVVALSRYPSAPRLPSRVRLRPRYAGSSGMPGRIEFVILWTGRSPPAALHPASWRRSCIQFQAGERLPEEDLHLSDLARSQAHIPSASAVWNFSFSLFHSKNRFGGWNWNSMRLKPMVSVIIFC